MSGFYYKRKQNNNQLQTKQKNNSRTCMGKVSQGEPSSFRPGRKIKIFVSEPQLRTEVFKNLV